MDPWMQVLPAKRQEGNCTKRYLRGSRNQNGEHIANLVNQTSSRNTSHIPYSYNKLARTLPPVESTSNEN